MRKLMTSVIVASVFSLSGTGTALAQTGAVYGLPAHILQIDLGGAISLEDNAADPSGSFVATYSYRVSGPFRIGAALGASIPEHAEVAGADVSATFAFVGPLAEVRFATASVAVPRLFAGIAFHQVEWERDFGSGAVTVDDDKFGIFAGGGVDFKLSRKIGLGGDIQVHSVNMSQEFAGLPIAEDWYQFLDVHISMGIYF
jgi:hypothetical protein